MSPSSRRSGNATASGLGQHIDMALLDVQVAGLTNLGLGYLATGRVPPAPAIAWQRSIRATAFAAPTAT